MSSYRLSVRVTGLPADDPSARLAADRALQTALAPFSCGDTYADLTLPDGLLVLMHADDDVAPAEVLAAARRAVAPYAVRVTAVAPGDADDARPCWPRARYRRRPGEADLCLHMSDTPHARAVLAGYHDEAETVLGRVVEAATTPGPDHPGAGTARSALLGLRRLTPAEAERLARLWAGRRVRIELDDHADAPGILALLLL